MVFLQGAHSWVLVHIRAVSRVKEMELLDSLTITSKNPGRILQISQFHRGVKTKLYPRVSLHPPNEFLSSRAHIDVIAVEEGEVWISLTIGAYRLSLVPVT